MTRTTRTQLGAPYANCVFVVLALICALNFLERETISIRADEIEADLCLGNARMGFLMGAAFAVGFTIHVSRRPRCALLARSVLDDARYAPALDDVNCRARTVP